MVFDRPCKAFLFYPEAGVYFESPVTATHLRLLWCPFGNRISRREEKGNSCFLLLWFVFQSLLK